MRRFILAVVASALLVGFAATGAAAAPNPSGTGQPSVECGEQGATIEPSGFSTDGFANAEDRYAGSEGTPSALNGGPNAVSQYDVACYQVTSSHS
jgi:hypothetical protein